MSLTRMRSNLARATRILRDLRAEEERKQKESRGIKSPGGSLRLYDFVKAAWHLLEPDNPFVDNWHIGCICEHLEAVTALEIVSLIINIPPRHAKSLLVSVFWFAWVWTLNPYSRWVFASYGENLAHRDAVKSRDVITSGWYRNRWGDVYSLRGDQNAKEKIQNDKQGFRIATTVAGRALGEGGSYFVVDDPHKVEDSESPVLRQKVVDWWTGTVSTRGNDPKTFRRVVVMQRLHERDLSGYLTAEVGGYEQLVIPVEYEPRRYWFMGCGHPKPKDAIVYTKVQMRSLTARDPRKAEGELLWPARFNKAIVDGLRAELLHRAAGQLQQRPSDPEGSIFRRATFRTFHVENTADGPAFILIDHDGKATKIPVGSCRIFQCVDTATKIKKRNDYTAVVTAFLTPGGNLLIYDVVQVKIESPHLLKFLRSMRLGPTRWDSTNLNPVRVGRWPLNQKIPGGRQYVEDASSGTGIIQTAAVEANPVKRLSAAGDKIEKAVPLAVMYENGKVYHLAAAGWRTDFEDELVTFPNAAHDDRTDAAGGCGRVATEDRALRMGLVALEDVAADYPEFVDWQNKEAETKARDAEQKRMKAEALASVGMEDPKERRKRQDDEDREKPEPKTFKIKVSGGELELEAD